MMYDDKVYGKQEIKDKLALDIIKTKEMQRLKGVNQYGVWKYVTPNMNTTRFEHCLGVYFLLRLMSARREEQIAGLIHDIGHTALSHAYDYVIGRSEQQDYNDEAQAAVVINSEIRNLLLKEGIDPGFILDHKNFLLLEKELPDICADRIDYILRDSLIYGIITPEDIPKILGSIKTDKNRLFFTNLGTAKRLASIFMQMDSEYYRSPTQSAIYHLIGEALKIAIEKGIVQFDDLFRTDEFIMEKLRKSNSQEILEGIGLINPSIKVEDNNKDYDFFVKGKCRYIDPFISVDGKLKRLSDIDSDAKRMIVEFKREHSKGRHIKIIRK